MLAVVDAVAVAPTVARATFVLAVGSALTIWLIAPLLDPAFVLFPLYEATIEYVPADSALVEQAAVRTLPEPTSATALQEDNAVPLFLNATLPVGDEPVTVAVKVTVVPATTGLAEDAREVVVAVSPVGGGGVAPVELTCTDTPVALAEITLIVVP